ncbi:Squalene/phytoene synthase [Kalmanozyma brasiliensis GHG001]|uniref:Bifunctional lycopene cyclase/phytoene synthase n=1 Tax=Kalmanozyma brasiliensis (strain GHG001) TaxID=1365824 RepID=V5EPM7_KALBG|nr:Squalene/phytoene synthase [Kalmanozyma brasiliensis GHG001]EST07035.1 Squalene/phytoene synthase [Kalmanozyma brasiliensis GHG001]
MTKLYQPNQDWPACTLSYRHFHLLWTLPLCAVLFLIARPFLTKLDRAKLILLPIIAFVWTTPWDNLIVMNRAWFYHRHCIWFTIGYVPIEEYFFFIIQSLISTLWCTLLTRWTLPSLYIAPTSSSRQKLATPALVACLLCFVLGLKVAVPETHSYYFGMISWWASLPLALLLWGSVDFVRNMGIRAGLLPFAFSVLVPTVYLWASDVYALRRGTWHINEATSLNIFPIPDLPLEEMLFFLVTNLILVSACFTFDRCVAICRQSAPIDAPPLSPSYLPLGSLATYSKLWSAFVSSDHQAAQTAVTSASVAPHDLSASLKVLRAASKSFNAASLLLPWDLRTDLGCLYAFCRVADDLVDDEAEGLDAKTRNLHIIRSIVDSIYTDSKLGRKQAEDAPVSERISLMLASAALSDKIKQDICAAAASIAPLARYIPKRLWYEMLDGYGTDLRFEHPDADKRTRLRSMDDLVEYSQCVAGVVGEMCTRVILGRCGLLVPLDLQVDRRIALQTTKATEQESRPLDLTQPADLHTLLYEARRMGVSLQLVNIARDIVPDSVELRRCYLPSDMFDKDDADMHEALLNGDLNTSKTQSKGLVQPAEVRKYALRLLQISRRLYDQSYPALGQIPNRPARAGLKAACSVYAAIGTKIEAQSEAEIALGTRARMSNTDRILRAISAVYFGV